MKTETNEFVLLVNDVRGEKVRAYNPAEQKYKWIDKYDIEKAWDGILLYSTNKRIDKSSYKKAVVCGILSVVLLLLSVIWIDLGWFYILNLAGGLVSLSMICRRYGIVNNISKAVCDISEHFNCDSVSKSRYSRILMFNLDEMALSYFLGLIVYALFLSFSVTNTAILGYIGLPVICLSACAVLYSVISQLILKKYCPLCIVVDVILVAEILYMRSFAFMGDFSLKYTVLLGGLFVVSCLVLLLCKKVMTYKLEAQNIRLENLRYKRNPRIAKEWIKQTPELTEMDSAITIGSASEVTITTWLSTDCRHCADLALYMIKLMDRYHDLLQWNIYFSHRSDTDKLKPIYESFVTGDGSLMTEIENLYKGRKTGKEVSLSGGACELMSRQKHISENMNFRYTPTIMVNRFVVPQFYTIQDVSYMLFDKELFTKTEIR